MNRNRIKNRGSVREEVVSTTSVATFLHIFAIWTSLLRAALPKHKSRFLRVERALPFSKAAILTSLALAFALPAAADTTSSSTPTPLMEGRAIESEKPESGEPRPISMSTEPELPLASPKAEASSPKEAHTELKEEAFRFERARAREGDEWEEANPESLPKSSPAPQSSAASAASLPPALQPSEPLMRAVIVPSKSTASCGESVWLSAESSHSDSEPIVEYQWDLNSNGSYDDAFGPTTEVQLRSPPRADGSFAPLEVGLRVQALSGASDSTRLALHLRPKSKNKPPTARIDSRYLYVDKEAREDVILNATTSSDPDGECDHLNFEWSCESVGERECKLDSMVLDQPILRIPWQNLEHQTSYFWTLKVSDLAGAIDSTSVVIESLLRKDPTAPSIQVQGKKEIDDGLAKDCIYLSKTGEAIWCADW